MTLAFDSCDQAVVCAIFIAGPYCLGLLMALISAAFQKRKPRKPRE